MAGPKKLKKVASSPELGPPLPVRFPVKTCFLKEFRALGMPRRLLRLVTALAIAALAVPLVKTAFVALAQSAAGMFVGLSDLKASPITWSSNIWSTFQGLGPLTWFWSSGAGIGETSGVVVVKTVNVADASAVPV